MQESVNNVKLQRALDCKAEIENVLAKNECTIDVYVTLSTEGTIVGSYKVFKKDSNVEDEATKKEIHGFLDAFGCKISVSVTIGTDGTYRGQYKVLAF